MDEPVLKAFLEDLARAMESWVDSVCTAVDSPAEAGTWSENVEVYRRLNQSLDGRTDDLRIVLAEAMTGLLHSVLVTMDGGSAGAEIGRVYPADAEGRVLADGLHELFYEHLLESGRMT